MADEILWRAHIHPALPCGKINEKTSNVLFSQIRFVVAWSHEINWSSWGDPPQRMAFSCSLERWRHLPEDDKSLSEVKLEGEPVAGPHIYKIAETISD